MCHIIVSVNWHQDSRSPLKTNSGSSDEAKSRIRCEGESFNMSKMKRHILRVTWRNTSIQHISKSGEWVIYANLPRKSGEWVIYAAAAKETLESTNSNDAKKLRFPAQYVEMFFPLRNRKKSQQTQVGESWGKWRQMLRDISKPASIVTNVIYVNKSHWFEKFLQ